VLISARAASGRNWWRAPFIATASGAASASCR
jgi:hypothetical protein